ncbi:MAG: decarboxylating NADP(+)-dependent phosphogluconate dehydrogenase [Gammaproteobacteria bacterium]
MPTKPEANADVGLIGLAVMGQNLVLNMVDHGYTVAVRNRTVAVTETFMDGPAAGRSVTAPADLGAFVESLERPRRVLLMVQAGPAVDAVIDDLRPLLEPGDIVVDCGNSHYADTERRVQSLRSAGLSFVGSGVSGGEEGARHGPSIMPGGDETAWPRLRDLMRAIAAQVDGEPCCDWLGAGGAGHYVKMVHNGIEYGDMQLIAEAYQLLHKGLDLDHDRMAQVFARYNDGVLDSYLIEITRDILSYRDEQGEPLVEKILDAAGQKGTGKWTGISALEHGVPVSLIGEAVFARCLSALKDQRTRAAITLRGPAGRIEAKPDEFESDLEDALYAAKIVSYAQGFMLMAEASSAYEWNLRLGAIALLWRGGCIIRSRFLNDIKAAFDCDPALENLLLDPFFAEAMGRAEAGLRRVVSAAALGGIPTPALSSALAFYDGYRSVRLPANMLQAQRDYFGGHTYERVDRPRGEFFHTNWTGRGGQVTSGSYDA